MFAKILAFLLLASPLFAVDYDTLFYGDIEDAQILWDTVSATSGTLDTRYWNSGGYSDFNIIETTDLKKRAVFKFSVAGLNQVPDTNAVVSAKLRVKTSIFSVPYYFKIYALYSDGGLTEGTMSGLNSYSFGHGGASWMSPSQPFYPDTVTGTFPSRFDWRDSNMVSTVKNQGICGSCWAHATIAQIEAVHKRNVIDWTTTNNAEDGTGADRIVAPMLTPSPEVTATGWEYRKIPAWYADYCYNGSGVDNGLILIRDSGDVKINTTEHASNKPHLIINFVSRDDASGAELRIDITSSDLLDSYINSGATTTNYGTADTARVNGTMRYLIRPDSLNALIKAFLVSDGTLANDTFQYATSCTLSLYMTKYANASIKACQLLKAHFDESQVTWNIWKTGYEWGEAGANKTDQFDLSEQQLVSCITSSDCANGGSITEPYFYFRDVDSVMTEEAFIYSGAGNSDDIACLDTFGTAFATKIGWAWRIPGSSERLFKQAVMIQPFTVSHDVNPSFSSFVYSSSNTCWYGAADDDSAHAVEIVGWDDSWVCDLDGGTGVWITKNQYGSGWGQDGFAYLSRNGATDLVDRQLANNSGPSLIISLTDTVHYWSTPGIVGGSEVVGLVGVTTDIAANGWQDIDIPAWVIRAMINGKLSRTIVLQAETGTGVAGVQFSSTEATTAADRPYLVLKSLPQSQVATKIGQAKIGQSKVGE